MPNLNRGAEHRVGTKKRTTQKYWKEEDGEKKSKEPTTKTKTDEDTNHTVE